MLRNEIIQITMQQVVFLLGFILVKFLKNYSDIFHYFYDLFILGSISAQRCVLEARVFKAKSPESVASFLEEITVRRELSDNFCWYNKDIYDKFEGAHNWAQTTLNAHR